MQTALITGATRGIGRAIAADLGHSHHILVGGRSSAAVAEVVSALPSASPFVAELTDPAALASAVEGIETLDVLVHSAGIALKGRLSDLDAAQWRAVLEVNVIAVAELTRLLLPALRSAGGLVVLLNSGAGFVSRPDTGAYAASKFALRAYADALRAEEQGLIRVTSVHPGRVDTDMQREIQASSGNLDYQGELYLRPDTVASAVRFAVSAPRDANIDEISVRPANGA